MAGTATVQYESSHSHPTVFVQENEVNQVRSVVRDILDDVHTRFPPGISIQTVIDTYGVYFNYSLASGQAGCALAFAYAGHCLSDPSYIRIAHAYLDHAIDGLEMSPMSPGLYSGFTGIAWVVEHLRRKLPDFKMDQDPNEAIDEAIEAYISHPDWRGDYDLISGLVGLGVYLQERLCQGDSKRLMRLIVHHLERLSKSDASGVCWHTPPELMVPAQRQQTPQGFYNLGLAHGVPGVIGLLADDRTMDTIDVRRLLARSIQWVRSKERPAHLGGGFSNWLTEAETSNRARSAWCYGAPGIAISLIRGGLALGDEDSIQQGLRIAYDDAERLRDESGVVDASLCHGAAGLGMCYQAMHQLTKDERILSISRNWYREALEYRKPGDGVGGYLAVKPGMDGQRRQYADPGFLTGASGVALALLAASTAIPPFWNSVMLMSSALRSPQ